MPTERFNKFPSHESTTFEGVELTTITESYLADQQITTRHVSGPESRQVRSDVELVDHVRLTLARDVLVPSSSPYSSSALTEDLRLDVHRLMTIGESLLGVYYFCLGPPPSLDTVRETASENIQELSSSSQLHHHEDDTRNETRIRMVFRNLCSDYTLNCNIFLHSYNLDQQLSSRTVYFTYICVAEANWSDQSLSIWNLIASRWKKGLVSGYVDCRTKFNITILCASYEVWALYAVFDALMIKYKKSLHRKPTRWVFAPSSLTNEDITITSTQDPRVAEVMRNGFRMIVSSNDDDAEEDANKITAATRQTVAGYFLDHVPPFPFPHKPPSWPRDFRPYYSNYHIVTRTVIEQGRVRRRTTMTGNGRLLVYYDVSSELN